MPKPTRTPKHIYNWRPDLPDFRDYSFSEKAPRKIFGFAPKRAKAWPQRLTESLGTSLSDSLGLGAPDVPISQRRTLPTLPRLVDLRADCPPIVNQGKIGSCTGNALAGALGYLELQQLKTKTLKDDTQVFDPSHFDPFSRLFIYYNERAIENHIQQDTGASLRDGIKSLVDYGACQEESWDYLAKNFAKKPSSKAYKEAAKHKLGAYYRLEDLTQMKQCLAQGYPFVFGFAVYESFESVATARTGVARLPSSGEKPLGGHAVLAVGFDDTEKCLIVRNSWGAEWGQAGYFTLPYDYVAHPGLAQDFWVVVK